MAMAEEQRQQSEGERSERDIPPEAAEVPDPAHAPATGRGGGVIDVDDAPPDEKYEEPAERK
jgi:hypothetical protein